MRFHRDKFYEGFRAQFGKLRDQSQVDGLNFLLDKIEADSEWASVPQISYFVATVAHETAHTYEPIKEYRAEPGTKARARQDKYWFTGYFGRGYCQLTHKSNYQYFGIADDPDKALEPERAYVIAARGMREGIFTGKKLSDYINGKSNYRNARRVVNALDKANEIAERARKFETVLNASLITEPATTEEPPVQIKATEPPVAEIKKQAASIYTKVTAGAGPVIATLTGVGAKVGGVEFSTGVVIAFILLLAVALVVGAIVYDRGQQRALERARLNVQTLADPHKANVVTP